MVPRSDFDDSCERFLLPLRGNFNFLYSFATNLEPLRGHVDIIWLNASEFLII